MNKLLLQGLLLMLVAGCTTPYSCGQFPQTGCQPVSEVYRRTTDNFHDYRSELNQDEKAQKIEKTVSVVPGEPVLTYRAGDPILTKPQVMRILLNAWEDKSGDLNAGGFVYIRVKDSEWQLKE